MSKFRGTSGGGRSFALPRLPRPISPRRHSGAHPGGTGTRALWPAVCLFGGWLAWGVVAVPARESIAAEGSAAQDSAPSRSRDVTTVEFVGRTMGTTYSVKVAGPPQWDRDPRLEIESVLRAVNDEMSTYLESSELSRFNRAPAGIWFGVSRDVVAVVDAAAAVSDATGGVFDVTIGPLVDLWGFGAGSEGRKAPKDEQVREALRRVGHEHLESRSEPSALRKSVDDLQVDLSAIAKGHGVDRVFQRLLDLGAENVFVEVGGEVRATGKVGDRAWLVGIQQPDARSDRLLAAFPLEDRAMATSGDYRNRYVDGDEVYSHTLDPRTGRPVRHRLASVTVVAESCMMADAWATAIMALGGEAGRALAEEQDLDVLFVSRVPGDGYEVWGRGALEATSAEAVQVLAGGAAGDGFKANGADPDGEASAFLSELLPVVIVTVLAFAILLTVMAVGVLFGRPAISGSCGGLNARTGAVGENCATCGTPTEGCRELREKLAEAGVGRERDDSFGAH